MRMSSLFSKRRNNPYENCEASISLLHAKPMQRWARLSLSSHATCSDGILTPICSASNIVFSPSIVFHQYLDKRHREWKTYKLAFFKYLLRSFICQTNNWQRQQVVRTPKKKLNKINLLCPRKRQNNLQIFLSLVDPPPPRDGPWWPCMDDMGQTWPQWFLCNHAYLWYNVRIVHDDEH